LLGANCLSNIFEINNLPVTLSSPRIKRNNPI